MGKTSRLTKWNECDKLPTSRIVYPRSEFGVNYILISRKSDGQLITTYLDILNQRETEIDSLYLESPALLMKAVSGILSIGPEYWEK